METEYLNSLLAPYNPWWEKDAGWELFLPDYERCVVGQVLADLRELPQIISITGPRRVGKSTAVKHVIRHLIKDQGVPSDRILYFSLDDPDVVASEHVQRVLFDQLVTKMVREGRTGYLFLDEVQRLPRWELYLKKHYDLKTPLRFVVSGSASSPIFRSSQESLLGRIKDRHLLPFSFREFCLYQLRHNKEFSEVLASHRTLRSPLLEGDGPGAVECISKLARSLSPFTDYMNEAVRSYCREGGFPEVWALSDPIRKIEYLMEQQVRKVLYEDLMMLTQYRKPENVLRFFVYLLAHPGLEINASKVANEAEVERRVVEENLPRLEMTDLILRVPKFTHQPFRVRRGNLKTYPIDMALRNAVLKNWDSGAFQGVYAENLVVKEIITWPEKIEVTYFRENKHGVDREVDFVVTHAGNKHLPIEVKTGADYVFPGLSLFMKRYQSKLGVVVDRGSEPSFKEDVLTVPLRYFLLMA